MPAMSDQAQNRYERIFEYDSLTPRFANFLIEELIPEVAKTHTLSTDPERPRHRRPQHRRRRRVRRRVESSGSVPPRHHVDRQLRQFQGRRSAAGSDPPDRAAAAPRLHADRAAGSRELRRQLVPRKPADGRRARVRRQRRQDRARRRRPQQSPRRVDAARYAALAVARLSAADRRRRSGTRRGPRHFRADSFRVASWCRRRQSRGTRRRKVGRLPAGTRQRSARRSLRADLSATSCGSRSATRTVRRRAPAVDRDGNVFFADPVGNRIYDPTPARRSRCSKRTPAARGRFASEPTAACTRRSPPSKRIVSYGTAPGRKTRRRKNRRAECRGQRSRADQERRDLFRRHRSQDRGIASTPRGSVGSSTTAARS